MHQAHAKKLRMKSGEDEGRESKISELEKKELSRIRCRMLQL